MNKIIDINDVNSYPKKLIELFEKNSKDIDYDEIFKKYYFKCYHACNTYNIENYKKYGIMRPYYVNRDGMKGINYDLKEILLFPFKGYQNYNLYSKKYDEELEKVYERNKNLIPDWYGKYSCIYYTLIKMDTSSPAYEPIISLYGGEIFRDIGISEKILEELGKKCKSYIICFKLSYYEIQEKCIYFPEVVEHMKKIYDNKKSNYRFENNINKDIAPQDIIDFIEVNR